MTKPLGMELGSNILHQVINCLEFPLHILAIDNLPRHIFVNGGLIFHHVGCKIQLSKALVLDILLAEYVLLASCVNTSDYIDTIILFFC